jgi:hypothetical protein
VNFESHQVRELLENGLPNRDRSGFCAWPYYVESGGLFETLQNFVDSIDELVAPARTPLLIPERGSTDFCPCVRMKIDPHDGG